LFIQTLETRQGLMVACPEEIAYRQGYITAEQLETMASAMKNSGYGGYLLQLLRERVFWIWRGRPNHRGPEDHRGRLSHGFARTTEKPPQNRREDLATVVGGHWAFMNLFSIEVPGVRMAPSRQANEFLDTSLRVDAGDGFFQVVSR
jgi:hypothetical protein